MKRILLVGFWLLYGILRSQMIFAYEILTHQDISQKALEASILASPSSVLSDIQLQAVTEDSQKFPGADGAARTILDLVLYGAEQEDDLGFPGVGGSRFMHHFYDPVNNSALTDFTSFDLGFVSERFGVPYQPIQKSSTWALENNGDFPNNKFTGQIFSYKDARGYFYKALTELSTQERDKYFGLTFQTLGHVIHHIQDMAQPQHVKNEQHPLHPRSLYEEYTNKTEVRERLPFTGYTPVYSLADDRTTFDTPTKFWATGNGQGKGLAEFTSFNFVTYGHNFTGTLDQPQPNPTYPNPTPAFPTEISIIDLPFAPQVGLDQAALNGKMYFIKAPVTDAYRPVENRSNNLASAFSLYDDDLKKWNLHVQCQSMSDPSGSCTQQAVFTVNRFTMSAAHDFLIPRAVGYSAGLINYFFRGVGKINMVADPATPGHLIIRNDGEEMLSGNFTLYYDDVDGNRFAVVHDPTNSIAAAPWHTPDGGLFPGQSVSVPVFPPPGTDLRPAPKTPGEYMLVFQGTIGEEHDIAVAAKKVQGSGSTSFLTPAGRLQYTTSGWQFTPDTTLQFGNTYWNGTNTAVSWHGPASRYLINEVGGASVYPDGLHPVVYYQGAAIATPAPVLGAAIHENRLIVVVGIRDENDIVRQEEVYTKSLSNLAQSWTLGGSFAYSEEIDSGLPSPTGQPGPWYFSEDGTKAVSVKPYSYSSAETTGRVVCHLQIGPEGSASFSCDPPDLRRIIERFANRSDYTEHYAIDRYILDYQGNTLITASYESRETNVGNQSKGAPYSGSCVIHGETPPVSTGYTATLTRTRSLYVPSLNYSLVIENSAYTSSAFSVLTEEPVAGGPCELGSSDMLNFHVDSDGHLVEFLDLTPTNGPLAVIREYTRTHDASTSSHYRPGGVGIEYDAQSIHVHAEMEAKFINATREQSIGHKSVDWDGGELTPDYSIVVDGALGSYSSAAGDRNGSGIAIVPDFGGVAFLPQTPQGAIVGITAVGR